MQKLHIDNYRDKSLSKKHNKITRYNDYQIQCSLSGAFKIKNIHNQTSPCVKLKPAENPIENTKRAKISQDIIFAT